MAYKITFDRKNEALLEYSELEKQSALYKKEEPRDEIYIKAEGRNIYTKPFNSNVIYSLYDYQLEKEVRKRLQIIILFDNADHPYDFLVKPGKASLYRTRRSTKELSAAIVAADKEYAKVGGGVLHKHPLWKFPAVLKKLAEKVSHLTS